MWQVSAGCAERTIGAIANVEAQHDKLIDSIHEPHGVRACVRVSGRVARSGQGRKEGRAGRGARLRAELSTGGGGGAWQLLAWMVLLINVNSLA